MENLHCDIEKSDFEYDCQVCEKVIGKDEYYLDTGSTTPYGVVVCLPCIGKIRTELIKKNPNIKLSDNPGVKL